MSRLTFVESAGDVRAAVAAGLTSNGHLVALTAAAQEALAAEELEGLSISALADTRALATVERSLTEQGLALATELEEAIAERHPPARFDGPGFLSGSINQIQHALVAIATRGFLMSAAIAELSPSVVTVFGDSLDPWVAADGYTRNPWLEVLEERSKELGFRLEEVGGDRNAPAVHGGGAFGRARARLAGLVPAGVQARRDSGRVPIAAEILERLDGLNVLMDQVPSYDWSAVASALFGARGTSCSFLRQRALDSRWWLTYYEPRLASLRSPRARSLGFGKPAADPGESAEISDHIDAWLRARPEAPRIEVAGIDVFGAALQHLRALACIGPTLVRHADSVAERALEEANPDVVCFSDIASLAPARLAFQCRQRGIPALAYQHGGGYGTHQYAQHEVADLAHASHFLTYGEGISFSGVAAECVPVGSSRAEQMRARSRTGKRDPGEFRVLFVGEASYGNSIGGGYVVEDTERYLLEIGCLGLLGETGVETIYRPFPWEPERNGTTQWLARAGLAPLRADATTPLEELIESSDLVISDTSSGTVWNEVLAMGTPLLLYCDPEKTPLAEAFQGELARACKWCKSPSELTDVVSELAGDPAGFAAQLHRLDTSTFLDRYVLHRDDGRCSERALEALASAAHHPTPSHA